MDMLYHESTPEDYPEGLIQKPANVEKIYTVGRLGVKLTEKAYSEIITQQIRNKTPIDLILAVDGGVDSLMLGTEEDTGTVLEDFIALAALKEFGVDKIVCCAGFGSETEENLNHYQALANMSQLVFNDGFLGSFSLTRNMNEFIKYKEECERVWAGKRKSHIQSKIIAAVEGKFGDQQDEGVDARVAGETRKVFVSPLTSIFWLFKYETVFLKNIALRSLMNTNTFVDAKVAYRQFREQLPYRMPHLPLPL